MWAPTALPCLALPYYSGLTLLYSDDPEHRQLITSTTSCVAAWSSFRVQARSTLAPSRAPTSAKPPSAWHISVRLHLSAASFSTPDLDHGIPRHPTSIAQPLRARQIDRSLRLRVVSGTGKADCCRYSRANAPLPSPKLTYSRGTARTPRRPPDHRPRVRRGLTSGSLDHVNSNRLREIKLLDDNDHRRPDPDSPVRFDFD